MLVLPAPLEFYVNRDLDVNLYIKKNNKEAEKCCSEYIKTLENIFSSSELMKYWEHIASLGEEACNKFIFDLGSAYSELYLSMPTLTIKEHNRRINQFIKTLEQAMYKIMKDPATGSLIHYAFIDCVNENFILKPDKNVMVIPFIIEFMSKIEKLKSENFGYAQYPRKFKSRSFKRTYFIIHFSNAIERIYGRKKHGITADILSIADPMLFGDLTYSDVSEVMKGYKKKNTGEFGNGSFARMLLSMK